MLIPTIGHRSHWWGMVFRTMKRRHFLQATAATLTTLGLNQLDLERKRLRYAKALSQSTPRKLALLVGINRYPQSQRFNDLRGCLNDVELQRQLLIHRFGFQDADICVLSDDSDLPPTRANILQAFQVHLIDQAQDDAVVVFHFSGHGSELLDDYPLCGTRRRNASFVPVDAPTAETGVHDIMGRSLFLLMSQVRAENITVVLDSCFSGGGTRGNVRIRAVEGMGLQPSEQERAFQEEQLSRLPYGLEELERLRCQGVAKGVVLAAAQPFQESADVTFAGEAKDAVFSDFDAGAFTYFLTQYLWNQTDSVRGVIATIDRNLRSSGISQTPLYEVKANSGFEAESFYFIDEIQAPPSDATILQVENNQALIWLGGINPDTLDAIQTGSRFAQSTDGRQREAILIRRQGLLGQVLLTDPNLTRGALTEISRVIPSDFKLCIGIDPSLREESDLITTRLRSLRRIEPVPHSLNAATCGDLSRGASVNTPYPSSIQYILSRMTRCYWQFWQQSQVEPIPAVNSIGLFSQDLSEIIPDSFHVPDESVDDAIIRLRSKLTSLVAARLIKFTLNANSSQLHLEAAIKLEENFSETDLIRAFRGTVCEATIGQPIAQAGDIVARAFTTRGAPRDRISPPLPHQIPLCTLYYLEITNHEPDDLFLTVLGIASSGEIAVLFPNPWSGFDQDPKIAGNSTLQLPDPAIADKFAFFINERGIGEILIIASRAPLSRARASLQSLAAEQPQGQRSFVMPSVAAIEDLLSDMDGVRGEPSNNPSSRTIYTSEIAAFSITFEAA